MITHEDNPKDWFALAEERLRAADTLFAAHGPCFSAVELLQEAVERYLKGYLIAQGWKLEKTHDLSHLLDIAIKHDVRFDEYYSLAEGLTQDYWAQHYPGADLTDVGSDYRSWRDQTQQLIGLIVHTQ
jgi:HEPN domain-containing protein